MSQNNNSSGKQPAAWRSKLGALSAREIELGKTMGHHPRARTDPELLRSVFRQFKAMSEGTGSRGAASLGSEDDDQGLGSEPQSAPLQTLVISTERERLRLEEADRATQNFQLLDADFLRGDWLARLFYGCLSDDPEYELREVAWRYTQLDFLCRTVMACDRYCFGQRHREEQTCCGVLDPRARLDLHQILYPENWNGAYGCPYKTWSEFQRDYNAWGRGEGPRPRWLPKAPVTPKKAAEDVVAVYLLCTVAPLHSWFLGDRSVPCVPPRPPLVDPKLTEQFLERGNLLQGIEPTMRALTRCINGGHDRHDGFYEIALQMWSHYANFLPGPVEQVVHAQDLEESSNWTVRQWPQTQ